MKLTKLHIFIIILIALILCPTLGACTVQEGYVNRYPDTSAIQRTHLIHLGNKTCSIQNNFLVIANLTTLLMRPL